MKRAGIIETKLRKAYDLPAYARLVRGFQGASSTQRGADMMWEPIFQNIRITGGTGALRSKIVQCVILAFRPGGMVQILLNENAASMGVAPPALAGPGGENRIGYPSNTGATLQINQLYVPENPGIYAPSYGFRNSTSSYTNNGASVGAAIIRNDLIGGYSGNNPEGYTPIMGLAGLNFSSIRRWNSQIGPQRMYPGSSGAGTTTLCTAHDFQTGENVSIVNSTRPSYWRWFMTGPADIQIARTSIVIEDDPVLDAFFAGQNGGNSRYRASWHGGFVFGVYTNGQGPTGQRSEVIVTDAALTKYWLLKFIPTDADAQGALSPGMVGGFGAQPPEIAIDKYGILWFYPYQSFAPYSNAIYTTFDPIGWDIPYLTYQPRASISLGCMDTCIPSNPQTSY